jgi:hypothetical protein
MDNPSFRVHDQAKLAYSIIARPERKALDKALKRLAALPPERWPEAGAARLNSPEPIYFLPINDTLRAYVQPAEGGKAELLDLVRQGLLDNYFGGGPLGNGAR